MAEFRNEITGDLKAARKGNASRGYSRRRLHVRVHAYIDSAAIDRRQIRLANKYSGVYLFSTAEARPRGPDET